MTYAPVEATEEARTRAAAVRLLVLDVDGVLTDGRLYYSADGEAMKAFDVTDGLGIKMAQQAGVEFAIITGRRSEIVAERAEELGIEEVHQRILDKLGRLREVLDRKGLPWNAVGYIGDDLIDVPAMRRVGFAAAPQDARTEALEAAHWVSRRNGGRGAVRDVIEFVLKQAGKWERAAGRFLE